MALQSIEDYVISNPAEAINVLEFEAAARKALPPAHWGYMAGGVDDDALSRLIGKAFLTQRSDTGQCSACHPDGRSNQPNPANRALLNTLTWDTVRRLKDTTSMKILVKGIESPEDAELCVQYGADGIIVSNHGGRATETGRATIENLPGVVQVVRNRIPVLIDGGFRRGTDVFKALALGARAICIGQGSQK